MPRRRRRWLVLAAIVAAVAVAVVALAPTITAWLIRSRGVPRIEERIGRAVRLGGVKARWGRIELTDLTVDGAGAPDPIVLPRVTVILAMGGLLHGELVIDEVILERPRLNLVRNESGDDNVSSIVQRLRGKGTSGGAGGGGRAVRGPALVRVIAGTVSGDDDSLGTLEVRAFDALARRDGVGTAEAADVQLKLSAGPGAQARKVAVSFTLKEARIDGLPSLEVEGGALTLWKGFALSGIAGAVTPVGVPAGGADSEGAKQVRIDLKGGYGGVDRVLWSANGMLDLAQRTGDLSLVAKRFDLGQLKPILAGTPVIEPEKADIDARVDLHFHGDQVDSKHLHDAPRERGTALPGRAVAGGAEPSQGSGWIDFEGRFHLNGLSVFHPMLGPFPVRGLGVEANAKGRLEPKARTLHLQRADVDFRGVHATLTADAEKLGKKPAFSARLTIAPLPCQTALEALPSELTPALQGFKLAGQFKTDLHAAIDLGDLDQDVDLGGVVGIDGCNVLESPALVGAARLAGSFDHAVEVQPGDWLGFIAGPDDPDFVPFAQISPHLVNSIITTEDSTFWRHKGFIPSEFRSALKANLERGYFRLGASSITMQMVKNVLLSREKTLSRKLQELFLTWYVEKILPKERILEIYFNVIEFGPRLYGIGRAARHYFGKSARELTPREAAWFSSILPNPKRRYTHFCHGAPDAKWELYLNRILKRMHERGRITDDEHTLALSQKLSFNRAEALPEKECLELVKKMTTPPPPGALPTGAGPIAAVRPPAPAPATEQDAEP